MKSIIYLLCACWIACLLSTGCKHSTDYEKSPSVQLTTLIQDSIIRYKPQEAEMLLAKAKQQAQDSTEYYYAEAVHSSLLMTRQQEDSAFSTKTDAKSSVLAFLNYYRFITSLLE